MMKFVLGTLVMVMATSVFAADVYKIDTKASSVAWKGSKKMGSFHVGSIVMKEGSVTLDKKGQLSAGNFVIDMATIANEDLKDSPEYQKKLVGHLSSEDFFNVAKFPTAVFKVTSVTAKSKEEALVKGDLTMIGKTNAIEFPVKLSADKGVVTGEANVKVDRTKWGLKYGSGNFFKELAGDKIINDEFELTLKLVAKK
ncbi:YceI family protein [Bdellovibrio sp.]|uniref:YceI family protein n=1 Tax=Bdellovibrio sp. TaxID=28201 RepID=UPI0039E37A97